MIHQIVITAAARRMLAGISDRRVREKIGDTIDSLASDPELRGKPLGGDLKGYRSVPPWDSGTESSTVSNARS